MTVSLRVARAALRQVLGTWTGGARRPKPSHSGHLLPLLHRLTTQTRKHGAVVSGSGRARGSPFTPLPSPSADCRPILAGLDHAGTVWKASRVLCHYLRELPAAVWPGATVLELGCGCGLAGFAAAALGAEAVWASQTRVLGAKRP